MASFADDPWWIGIRGLSAEYKTRSTLARLRASGVTGRELLEVGLAVAALVGVRDIPDDRYLNVQIAKALVRRHAPAPQFSGWRPSENSARGNGRWLAMLGKQVWFYVWIVGTREVLTEIVTQAQPKVAMAAKAEARRQAKLATRQRTEAAIARVILRAREQGAGPAELARIEARLRGQYGLKVTPNGR